MNIKKNAWLIFFATLALFLAGVYALEFIKIDCRTALFVKEFSLRNWGPFPTIFGKPYFDYTPFHTFLMSLVAFVFGSVNMFTLTLPSALAAAGVMSFTYLIGTKISNKVGLLSVILLAATYEFLSLARVPSIDMFVALTTVVAFYLTYNDIKQTRFLNWLYISLLMFAGLLIRGPIGLIIPAGVVFAANICARRFKLTAVFSVIAIAILGTSLFAYIKWIDLHSGDELLECFLESQIFHRMGRCTPFWFYFTNALGSYALCYPLALLVVARLFYRRDLNFLRKIDIKQNKGLLVLLTAWLLTVVIGMSIPGTKHLRYIVPAMPAAAILAAYGFANPLKDKMFEKIGCWLLRIFRFIPFIALIALLIGVIVLSSLGIGLRLPVFLPTLLFLIIGYAMLAGPKRVKNLDKVLFITALAMASFVVIKVMIIEPIEQYLESSQVFVQGIEEQRNKRLPICFLGIGPDQEDIKYLLNMKNEDRKQPRYIALNELDKLDTLPKGSIVIMKRDKFDSLPEDVQARLNLLLKGKLGHRVCSAFIFDDLRIGE